MEGRARAAAREVEAAHVVEAARAREGEHDGGRTRRRGRTCCGDRGNAAGEREGAEEGRAHTREGERGGKGAREGGRARWRPHAKGRPCARWRRLWMC